MKKIHYSVAVGVLVLLGQAALSQSPYVAADGKTLYYTSDRIQGFYKRDLSQPALGYEQLVKENNSLFNNKGSILTIPIHLPTPSKMAKRQAVSGYPP